jgi:hypothetical protein
MRITRKRALRSADGMPSSGLTLSRYLHENWHAFLLTIAGEAPDG